MCVCISVEMSVAVKSNIHIKQVPTLEEILPTAKQLFCQTFGQQPELACCAPGRVNLIGEHVDYCEGFVLPMVSTSLPTTITN